MATIKISHFSDILCIWAYVSEIRIDELSNAFKERIEIEFRLFPVFGNVPGKISRQWGDRGGIEAYSEHVRQIADQFDHLCIDPQVWRANQPYSSLPAHLYLSAVRAAEQRNVISKGSFLSFKKCLRNAFFRELADISNSAVLSSLMAANGLPVAEIEGYIASGEAHAALAEDMQLATQLGVTSSPTLIFNEDRQRLTGNVGYRIIEANVRELLEHPEPERSWC